MLAFHRRWMQKGVLSLFSVVALREINKRFCERVDAFFEETPDDKFPVSELMQFSLIGFLFMLYVLAFATLGMLIIILVHVLFNNKAFAGKGGGGGGGMPDFASAGGMPQIPGGGGGMSGISGDQLKAGVQLMNSDAGKELMSKVDVSKLMSMMGGGADASDKAADVPAAAPAAPPAAPAAPPAPTTTSDAPAAPASADPAPSADATTSDDAPAPGDTAADATKIKFDFAKGLQAESAASGSAAEEHDAPEFEEEDNDDSIFSFFFNSFFMYWLLQCVVYGLLHFCVFCVYMSLISMQINAFDNPTYIKTVAFYYISTYALGVFSIMMMI